MNGESDAAGTHSLPQRKIAFSLLLRSSLTCIHHPDSTLSKIPTFQPLLFRRRDFNIFTIGNLVEPHSPRAAKPANTQNIAHLAIPRPCRYSTLSSPDSRRIVHSVVHLLFKINFAVFSYMSRH